MIRAFLAVEFDAALRSALSQFQQDLKRQICQDTSKAIRISWVQPESIHLTIKFLGDMDEQMIDPLRAAVTRLAPAYSAIQVPVERVGAFPHPQQPRVLWVGPSEQWERSDAGKGLVSLHRAIEDCCHSFGFQPEGRPFSPHVTIARVKGGERVVGQALVKSGVMDRPLSLGFPVKAVTLMKSDLRPSGPTYTQLWNSPVPTEG